MTRRRNPRTNRRAAGDDGRSPAQGNEAVNGRLPGSGSTSSSSPTADFDTRDEVTAAFALNYLSQKQRMRPQWEMEVGGGKGSSSEEVFEDIENRRHSLAPSGGSGYKPPPGLLRLKESSPSKQWGEGEIKLLLDGIFWTDHIDSK